MFAADRNLLFGVLALQLDFISSDALIAAMKFWMLEKGKPLGEILQAAGALSPANRELLEPLVVRHLEQHENDPQKSLSTLGTLDVETSRRLADVVEDDLFATISVIGSARSNPAQFVANAGASTSTGGRFRVVRFHAKGGLGHVSVARDVELNREVALKEIKPEFADHTTARGRFVLEAEITGGLEHPGIVPVYGLGTYPDGRPYYAMRFIKGDTFKDTIDRYHDPERAKSSTDSERILELRQLLGRFIDVCQAVEYAHSRQVLHRDLKPANIMLGKYGETLVVDWGLAKPTAARETDADTAGEIPLRPASSGSVDATEMGQRVGTLQYMSPEQSAGKLDELGPAADIFSLGATLYHLLTGKPVYHRSTKENLLEHIATATFPAPRGINHSIPKPLEAICLKALAAQPADRYSSAAALLQDLEHWLADEPVTAYREPVIAQARRVLRKRPMVTGSILASLLVGLFAFGIGYVLLGQKNRELSRTNANLVIARQDALGQKAKAEVEKERVSKAMNFLVAAFRTPDPEQSGREVKAADILLTAAEEAQTNLADEPLLQAELLTAIRQTLHGLGLFVESLPIAKTSAKLRKDYLGPDHPSTLETMSNLASAYEACGQSEAALALFEDTLKRRQTQLGPDHFDTLASMNSLAVAYDARGQNNKAMPLLKETLRKRQTTLGAEHPDVLSSMNNLASGYMSTGQMGAALKLFESTLQKSRAKYGPTAPETFMYLSNLASAYKSDGQLDKALPLYEEAVQVTQAKLGFDHPNSVIAVVNLASAYKSAGNLNKALTLYEEALQNRQAKLGHDHPLTHRMMLNLASSYLQSEQHERALQLYEESLRLRQAKLGPNHPDTLSSMHELAAAYHSAGRESDALALHEETLKKRQSALGLDHPDTISSMDYLAGGYCYDKQYDKALQIFNEILRLNKTKFGIGHPSTLASMGQLAEAYGLAGQRDKALSLYDEIVQKCRSELGADHPMTLLAMNNLANIYKTDGRLELALALYEQSLEKLRDRLGYDHPNTISVMGNLANGYNVTGQSEKAIALYKGALETIEAQFGSDHDKTLTLLNNLGTAYWSAKDLDKALPILERVLEKRRARQGNEHLETVDAMNNLGSAYYSAGQLERATALFESALEAKRTTLGSDHPDTLNAINNLAFAWHSAGQLNKAVPLFEELLQKSRVRFGSDHPQTRQAISRLVKAYLDHGERATAVLLWREYVTLTRPTLSPMSSEFASLLANGGLELLNAKAWSAAEETLQEALTIREQQQPDEWTTFNTQSMFGGALAGRGRELLEIDSAGGEKLLAEAEIMLLTGFRGMLARKDTIPAAGRVRLTEATQRLVDLYTAWEKPEQVEKWKSELEKLK